MTLSAQEKGELARYRLDKAKSLLRDAETLFQASSNESSANRSYYAVLAAARALLALRGKDPESHEGVKVFLSKEFIKPGILPAHSGEIFRVLQARRMDSDYGDFVEIRPAEAEDSLKKAREFVAAVEKAVAEILGEPEHGRQ
jgi:uncharacterized protein (UPF0332 family)